MTPARVTLTASSFLAWQFVVLDIVNRGAGKLTIERFSVREATAQELRPWRYGNLRIDRLRQQTPELGMMPAEIVARTVPMSTDARPESLHLGDERLAVKALQILVRRLPFQNLFQNTTTLRRQVASRCR
ncbi:MAG: hypothetical protein KY462_13455 [Actinobacteria bacterium]|nr:hypothetical protein [Actinomycetota bacterium]